MAESNKDKKGKYERSIEKAITAYLKSSLAHVLLTRNFSGENYYKEDITEILADFQTLILSTVNELIDRYEGIW